MSFNPDDFAGWSSFVLPFLGSMVATTVCIALTIWIWDYGSLKPIPVCILVIACIQAGIFRASLFAAFCGSLLGSALTCAAGFFVFLYAMGRAFE